MCSELPFRIQRGLVEVHGSMNGSTACWRKPILALMESVLPCGYLEKHLTKDQQRSLNKVSNSLRAIEKRLGKLTHSDFGPASS
jgi:hypothetical protein